MKKQIGAVVALVALVAAGSFGYRMHLVNELRKPVLALMNDPDSAQFRGERLRGWTVADGLLCGEVNAKNRMGGYVGYRPFSAYGGFATVGDGDLMDDIVRVNCPARQAP